MPDYKSMKGQEARDILNKLGYKVKGTDVKDDAVMGLIVALAKEVKSLRETVESYMDRGI